MEYGTCRCGCGEKTSIALHSRAARGWIGGEPKPYIAGHQRRGSIRPIRYVVDEVSGCWLWQLFLDRDGYGTEKVRGRSSRFAHINNWVDKHGTLPSGARLDHLCRNPRCVNPDHLEPVTNGENIRRGKSAKLSYDTASTIRARVAEGGHIPTIAKEFDISRALVHSVANDTNRWNPGT